MEFVRHKRIPPTALRRFRARLATLSRRRQKVFVVGFNKTGTTSLEKLLSDSGLRLGSQEQGEHLLPKYLRSRHRAFVADLAKLIKEGEAFQDIPFSLPGVFMQVDAMFPESKFILSLRTCERTWLSSLMRFHSAKFNAGSQLDDEFAECAHYAYRGFFGDYLEALTGARTYDEAALIDAYLSHIQDVRNHFRDRPDQLMEFRVGGNQSSTAEELGQFLGFDMGSRRLQHLNRNDMV